MSATARRCAGAIRALGGEALLLRQGASLPFPAQVRGWRGEGELAADPLGLGDGARYKFYAPLDTAADSLRPGDEFDFAGARYHVLRREVKVFGGAPAYHFGILRRVSGGGAP